MTIFEPKIIALQFNDCINDRNLYGIEHLMTDDHRFIDSEDNQIKGKQNCLIAWESFFSMFPDYKNIFQTINSNDNLVTIRGYSTCSDKRLDGPGMWTAKIQDGKVAEWRVYEDTEENRQQLNINGDKKE